jgi:hypothetical protein
VDGLEVVGRGGNGVVYRGRQADHDRDVAVKVVHSPTTEMSAVDRWRREVTAMGRLSNHPNIVTMFSGGVTDDGLPYFVMPYLPGGSLKERLAEQGRMAPADVAAMGAKLAGALTAAHEMGVLHRDVKPDNVLLSPYGEPQLSDFGIARLADTTTTAAGTFHATIRYAAPEVLAGAPATEAVDVYGLGATLFTCLTGRAPFADYDEDSVVALIGRVASEAPADLRLDGVPAPLASVVERAMAKDPADRYPTAVALRAALEQAEAQLASGGPEATQVMPAAAPPTQVAPVVAPVARPSSRTRRRAKGPLVGAAALLVVALGGLGLLLATQADDDPGGSGTTGDAASVTTESTAPSTTTAAPTTAAPPPTTAAPAGDAAASLVDHATRYFEALGAEDYSAAYDMLSPAFQERQSEADFITFWRTQAPVAIAGDPRVDEAGRRVTVPISAAGSRRDMTLSFIPDGDEGWFVNGPQPG